MGREKKQAPGAAIGTHAKERHKKAKKIDTNEWAAPLPAGLVAKPTRPTVKLKHQSYFEIVENKEKKKKLEFQITCDRDPPPGFEFVPIGNPELTTACKEISREQDAMIFIVSASQNKDYTKLAIHLNRIGHHVRRTIVEQARAAIGQDEYSSSSDAQPGVPEPIPETQEEINAQADAALKDLFPRIPNFDRQMIIQHAFKKGGKFGGEPVVGMAADIPLSRRVQLAVLAHIRHNHTRYDKLLRETTYINARRAVEALCLDILVKWRGDEETGRDQLDEILREVVVISDDSDDSDEEDEESSSDESVRVTHGTRTLAASVSQHASPNTANARPQRGQNLAKSPTTVDGIAAQGGPATGRHGPVPAKSRTSAKKAQRGFKRYEAQAQRHKAWEEALNRRRHGQAVDQTVRATTLERSNTNPPKRQRISPSVARPDRGDGVARDVAMLDLRQPVESYPLRRSEASYVGRRASASRAVSLLTAPQPFQRFVAASTPLTEATRPAGFRPEMVAQDGNHGGHAPAPMYTRRHPDDLKDYLVPSIEPASPQSSGMAPQFIRPVHPDPARLEQVSSGRSLRQFAHPAPTRVPPREAGEYDRRRLGEDYSHRAPVSAAYDVDPGRSYPDYRRDQPVLGPPQSQEPVRIYRIREPLALHGQPAVASDGAATFQREHHRPLIVENGRPDLRQAVVIPTHPRYREMSPPRANGIWHPAEDAQRPMESRRVVTAPYLRGTPGLEPVNQAPSPRDAYSRSYEVRSTQPPVDRRQVVYVSDDYGAPPNDARRAVGDPAPLGQGDYNRQRIVDGLADRPSYDQPPYNHAVFPRSMAYDGGPQQQWQHQLLPPPPPPPAALPAPHGQPEYYQLRPQPPRRDSVIFLE